ncbi:CoA-transferase family III domain-containing protein [Hyaloraphidium curvatum]|nr:CoA-transferase family III domain-containing protein [Hyaloraphidium curvatum]
MQPGVLSGIRVVSLALNLPGPAALQRLRAMGAACAKVEPPAGDPMKSYSPRAYAEMHVGVDVLTADMKKPEGRDAVHAQLARSDVLLSSFRPSAMIKLGLGWPDLQKNHPGLSHVAIVGGPGAAAEDPGHDLTYMAENGLVAGSELPPTLYADMAGSLMASEAVLQAALLARSGSKVGRYFEVALSDAAGYLAAPRRWGLTTPEGAVGGAHAGYRVYACKDGRVAVAALEKHFAARLCEAAGVPGADMMDGRTREAVAAFLASKTRAELDALAADKDIPMHTLE